ncbi:MAG: hypothetical protein ACRDTT_13455 [Pseudonocardiaceae bacterium]
MTSTCGPSAAVTNRSAGASTTGYATSWCRGCRSACWSCWPAGSRAFLRAAGVPEALHAGALARPGGGRLRPRLAHAGLAGTARIPPTGRDEVRVGVGYASRRYRLDPDVLDGDGFGISNGTLTHRYGGGLQLLEHGQCGYRGVRRPR